MDTQAFLIALNISLVVRAGGQRTDAGHTWECKGSQKGNAQKNRCMDHREFGLSVTSRGLRTHTAVLAARHEMEGDEKRAAEQYAFKFAAPLEQRIGFAFDYLEAPDKKKS